MAFVTDSNRPQPLRQPPPTACLTASGAASEVCFPSNASRGGCGGGGLLATRSGRVGCPTCRAAGGGGSTPTSMAQSDPHVALVSLTTQMWGGGGGVLVGKTLSGQHSCSGAFGANIHSYTKPRARQTNPFLQPLAPHPFGGRPCQPPPPPPRQSNFQVAPWAVPHVEVAL